jgi:hypothetical protein
VKFASSLKGNRRVGGILKVTTGVADPQKDEAGLLRDISQRRSRVPHTPSLGKILGVCFFSADFGNKEDRRDLTTRTRPNRTSSKHLAVKDFVLFLTWRAGRADAASHQQGRTDRDQNSRPIGFKLEKPACEGVKM